MKGSGIPHTQLPAGPREDEAPTGSPRCGLGHPSLLGPMSITKCPGCSNDQSGVLDGVGVNQAVKAGPEEEAVSGLGLENPAVPPALGSLWPEALGFTS